MKTFDYKGFDHSGQTVRGLVEAVDERSARGELARRGVLVEKIAVAGAQRSARRLGAAERDSFYHELATLLRAGLPLTRALDVLIESPDMARTARFMAAVRDGIKEGGSLSAALAAADNGLSPFEQAAIDAGEQSGSLAEVCLRLGGFYKRQTRVVEKLRTAVTYPLIVLAAAVAVAVGMLGFMLARFEQVWLEAGIELPLLTRAVIKLGKHGVYALPVIALTIYLAILYLRRRSRDSRQFRLRMQGMRFRLPVYGAVYTALVRLRFAGTLELLLGGGVQLAEAAAIAGRATGNAWLESLLAKGCEAIRHGARLSDEIRRIPPLAAALPGWISAGEESGELPGMLSAAKERFELQFEQGLERSIRVIEPLLLLLVGAIVFVIALAILLPITSMNSGL
jgi:type II secretory pathway component PulF